MKKSKLIPIALAVCLGTPAEALRGVSLDTKCEAVQRIETGLGSKLKGVLPRESTEPRKFFFDGTHLGYASVISYDCEAGVVTSQLITAQFSSEKESQVAFSEFRRALVAEFGSPSQDADEPAISALRPPEGSVPLRFTSWFREGRTVGLMLTGEEETWELVLLGP